MQWHTTRRFSRHKALVNWTITNRVPLAAALSYQCLEISTGTRFSFQH